MCPCLGHGEEGWGGRSTRGCHTHKAQAKKKSGNETDKHKQPHDRGPLLAHPMNPTMLHNTPNQSSRDCKYASLAVGTPVQAWPWSRERHWRAGRSGRVKQFVHQAATSTTQPTTNAQSACADLGRVQPCKQKQEYIAPQDKDGVGSEPRTQRCSHCQVRCGEAQAWDGRRGTTTTTTSPTASAAAATAPTRIQSPWCCGWRGHASGPRRRSTQGRPSGAAASPNAR
jgi:hypothetical protein